MTRGFYEQLGVSPRADFDELKAGYARSVAHLLNRREATLARAGDPAALDLARTQLDEAWEVLSNPSRRRRYDAMLAVAGDGLYDAEIEGLWARVSGSMIHPAVSAAARIVDAATGLKLAPLPDTPRPVSTRPVVHSAVATSGQSVESVKRAAFGAPRVVTAPAASSGPPPPPAEVVPLHADGPNLRVVRSLSAPGAVVDLSATSPGTTPTRVPVASTGDADQLVDSLGYGGALLAAVRNQQGLDIQTMSDRTRISARYLEAVEREDFATLPPAAAFVRGYVREMARLLGLDPDRVAQGYMRRFENDA